MPASQSSMTTQDYTGSRLPPLLRLSPSLRLRIFSLAGVPKNVVFHLDAPGTADYKYMASTIGSRHGARQKFTAVQRGLELTSRLSLTCRTISSEVGSLLFSNNTFITQSPEPLMKLSPRYLASIKDLHIILGPLRGRYERLCDKIYHSQPRSGSVRPEVRRATLETWQRLAPFLSQSVRRDHQLHLALVCDLAVSASEEENIRCAESLFEGLAHFPPLASCRIRLGHLDEGSPDSMMSLQRMSRGAARKAMGVNDLVERPFRYMHLPLEIRLRILEHTDLVLPLGIVSWTKEKRFSRFLDPWKHKTKTPCTGLYSGRRRPRTGAFCTTRYTSYTPWCTCWRTPVNFLVLSKDFSAEARHTFYTKNHLRLGRIWSAFPYSRQTWDGHSGVDFAKFGLGPSSWGLLRSVDMHIRQTVDKNKATDAHADRKRTMEALRAAEGLNLRYLGLCVDAAPLLNYDKISEMDHESRIEVLRTTVHNEYWPLDTGAGSDSPLGTQLLEVMMYCDGYTARYRLRASQQKPPAANIVMSLFNNRRGLKEKLLLEAPTASRTLIGGNPGRPDGSERNDGLSHPDTNWVEEIWILPAVNRVLS